jgi:hypothetical protein
VTGLKLVNLALLGVLLLTVRKLVWCIHWLWCYYHGREVPDPISFLPRQSGRVFEGHLPGEQDEEGP